MAVEAVLGARTAWHCELDPAASKVLAHRWPGVPNLGNLKFVDWQARYAQCDTPTPMPFEPVDIITAGYPCQPFSPAGKRLGENDERHLWPYVAEAIRGIRPRLVVLENVAGHRSLGFDRVLGDLAEIGYDAQWCSLRASDVGAPHKRERLFVLAADTHRARLERPESTRRYDLPARRHSPDVALLPTPAAADGARGPDFARANRKGSGGDDLVTIAARASRGDGWGKYAAAIARWESITRPAPAPTIANSKGTQVLNPELPEWMQGWPAGWVTDIVPGDDAIRIAGNGVVPRQAAVALRWLLSVCEAVG